MKLYGVYNPEGVLKGVCHSSGDAQDFIFNNQSRDFMAMYWHKERMAYQAAKKLGWKIEVGEYQGSGKFLK